MPEPNYKFSSTDQISLVAEASRTVLQLQGAQELDAWDIDAGRVDDDLVDYIGIKKDQVTQQQKELGMEGVPFFVYANALHFSSNRGFEYGKNARDLVDELTPDEAKIVLPTLDRLMLGDKLVSEFFPNDLSYLPEQAYGESVTKLLPVLLALKRNEELPTGLPLKGGDRTIPINSYTFEDAVRIIDSFSQGVGRIHWLIENSRYWFTHITANRVYTADNFAMYRVADDKDPAKQMLVSVRLKAGKTFNPKIEYGNREGTQQSIGFTVDMGRKNISPYKDEQVNPLSIRIDNEGDKVALDIGSILGKKGTLGKEIADLIALGDYLHVNEVGGSLQLNHSDRPFKGRELHQEEIFGRVAGATIALLEGRTNHDLPKVLARAGKAGASLLRSAGSR